MIESDLEYLRRRSSEEEQRAAEVEDPHIAAIHARLAGLYADRVTALADNPDFDPIDQLRPKSRSPTSSR